jgi:hypothetical protein
MTEHQHSLLLGFVSGVSFVFALLAAWFWFASARSTISRAELTSYFTTPDGQARFVSWLAESARLNRWAAIWTGVSTLLAGVASILSNLF